MGVKISKQRKYQPQFYFEREMFVSSYCVNLGPLRRLNLAEVLQSKLFCTVTDRSLTTLIAYVDMIR